MSFKNTNFQLVIIVLVNLIIKVLYINCTPYSYDEIISVKDTLLDFGHIKHEAEWDNNPPFYYYCLWVWHKILPISEFNSRLLSAIFVALAIGFFFQFSKKYLGQKTAIYSTIFLTLSNFLTFYAQESRAYSLVLLLSVLSAIYFFKYTETPSLKNLLIVSLINFLLIYTHYITGLIVFFQFVNIVFIRKDLSKKFVSVSSAIILILVYVRFTKKQFLNILNYNKKDDFWLKPATLTDFFNSGNLLYFNEIVFLIFIFCLIYFLFNVKNYSKNDKFKFDLYLVSIGFISFFVLFLVGIFKAVFLARYLIFVVPFATAYSVSVMLKIHRYSLVILFGLIAIVLLNSNIYKESGMDYKAIANLTSILKKENDVVIINKRDNLALFEYYYSNKNFLKYKNFDSVARTQNVFGINELDEINKIPIKGSSTIFLVQSFHLINRESNELLNFFSKKENILFHTKHFKGIELSVYRARKK